MGLAGGSYDYSNSEQTNKDNRRRGARVSRAAKEGTEASPHKRRLKCDTNISPRRLMAHLLHQMVNYRTTLRGSEKRNATIARITIHTHATILKNKKKIIRVLRHAVSPAGVPIHRQDWVQDGTLLDVVRNEVWIFFCKIENGVSTKVFSKSNHTHRGGYKQNIMHRVNQG